MTERALAGLTVLECNRTGGAAYAAKLLADLGADVIKIEPPDGDPARLLGPFPSGDKHPDKSGLYLYLNCNKQGVTLNLEQPKGRELLNRLLAQVDVFVHDFTPKEAQSHFLNYSRLRPLNERLIVTSISPFGESGPQRDYKAYDLTLLSAGGWAWLNGWPGRPEMPPLRAYGYQTSYQAGVNAALATVGALFARLRTGKGQYIEVSARECITSIIEFAYTIWSYMETPTARYGQRPIHPIDMFECKDGGWIFALCVEEHQWQALVEVMGTPEWATWEVAANRFVRASNWDALRTFMEEWVREWNTDDLYRAVQAKRIPFAPASTLGDLVDSPHLKARGFFVEVAHLHAGKVTQPGAPYKLKGTPWEIRSPAPTLGQHNEAVLSRIGISHQELSSLREGGMV
jgi:crotonobetainyl-CoA:carnitine CoA-transferase CaiB-like acyl-CoA transferase